MGIIQRQTIKGSVYSYLGVITGFFATALIMPRLLSSNQIGLINVLAAISALYAQFSTLGFTNVTTRMFSWFRNPEKNHNGFAFLVILTGFAGFALALAAFLILKPHLIENNIEKSPLLVEYIWYLIPLIFFRMFFLLLDNYNKVLYDAITGTVLSDFVFRLTNLLLLGAFFMKWIDFPQYLIGYVVAICFPAVYLAVMLLWRRQLHLRPQLRFISPPFRKEMIVMGIYGIVSGLSSVALVSIDKIMVNGFFGLSLTGIYSISSYFATIILIPNRALSKISSAVLADAWKDNNLQSINSIYYKSSINQLLAGCLLFILMAANLHNIFTILPPEYAGGEMVIVFISLGNLFAVATGVSANILATSSRYKVHTYQVGILIVLTVVTNLVFIPLLGINGAALASMTSTVIFSVIRIVYLKKKMDLFPFRSGHLRLLAVSAVALLAGMLIPRMNYWMVDLVIRCTTIVVLFMAGILITNVSEEAGAMVKQAWSLVQRARTK